MGQIKVRQGGFLTTVQDQGRRGYLKYGMPRAGAVDNYAFRLANLLVANEKGAAALELTFQGPELYFEQRAVIAITGADLSPQLDGVALPMWKALEVPQGSLLSFGALKLGLRSYIAIAGGIDVPLVMASRSTYLPAKVGGFKGRALEAGDKLKFFNRPEFQTSLLDRSLAGVGIADYLKEREIRVILGPQADYFTEASLERFLNKEYSLTNHCDRMGCRLEGPILKHSKEADIISDGVPLGAIQVPGQGKPIIMLADCQTSGGYAKIATVSSVDLAKVGQAKPGEQLSFKAISVQEAQEEYRALEQKIESLAQLLAQGARKPKKYFRVQVKEEIFKVEVEELD